MKVLMISTDKKIFERNSAVRQRVIEYGKLVEELHIIILNYSKKELGMRQQTGRISGSNVSLYPTNSKNKFLYIFDAVRIGNKIIKNDKRHTSPKAKNNWLITTQDPFETGLIGWLVAKSSKSKLQLQIHTDFESRYFQTESFLNILRSNIARFLIPQADGVRVVSERIKNSITKLKLKKESQISVLPIFVDTKKFENELSSFDLHKKYPQFDFIILTVARLEKEKNLSMALKVLSDITVKNSKIGLVVIGEGSLKENLQKEAVSLKVQDNVIFEGWQENLVSYYKTANLFMFTSNYEGYGLVLVESATSGCPIITSDVGIVESVLSSESVKVCKVGDRKCFSQGILDLKKNGLALYDMSIKARKKVEENIIKNKQQYLDEMKKGWEDSLK